MDSSSYEQLYRQLLSQKGREEIGDDPVRIKKMEERIQEFLDKYPESVAKQARRELPWVQLSLVEIYRRTLQTAIDIVRDISGIVSNRGTMSNAVLRRRIFETVTQPERRVYVGVWLVFISFILYFIDSAM